MRGGSLCRCWRVSRRHRGELSRARVERQKWDGFGVEELRCLWRVCGRHGWWLLRGTRRPARVKRDEERVGRSLLPDQLPSPSSEPHTHIFQATRSSHRIESSPIPQLHRRLIPRTRSRHVPPFPLFNDINHPPPPTNTHDPLSTSEPSSCQPGPPISPLSDCPDSPSIRQGCSRATGRARARDGPRGSAAGERAEETICCWGGFGCGW